MSFAIAAALALAVQSSSAATGTPVASNLEYVAPIAGNWTYAATTDASSATFSNEAGQQQLTIRCTRAVRQVTLIKPAASASPTMWIWTSSQTKNLPAVYDASAAQMSVSFQAFDPFLDSIASSRGRIGFSTSGLAALVVPPWAEVARVIEDCRV